VKRSENEENTKKLAGARTLKQRFLAIDLLHFLVKRTRKCQEEVLFRKLGENYHLLGQC